VSWLAVTLALYRKAFGRAAELTVANWPVLATVFVYASAMSVSAVLGSMLGILGGFLVSFVWAACAGSFLYLVEMMVRTARVSLADFQRSFGVYLWDVVGVTFLLWVFFAVVTPALATLPRGRALMLCLELAIFVFFNAVPELIYLGRCSSLELLSESYAFISENWIEWFPATLAMGVLVYAVGMLPLAGALAWLRTAVVALLIYFAMVVRGLLFVELHGTSRRGRAFRHRMGG